MATENTVADLVISVAELKSLEAWKLTGPQLLRRVASLNYCVIVPDQQVEVFRGQTPERIEVIGESLFTSEFEFRLDQAKGRALPARRGWYLQQLIKLSALKSASNLERVIIWDADTVPLKDIHFFNVQGMCRYYFGKDYHLPYFENIDRLLGLDKVCTESFIAQSFPMTGKQIRAFFSFLEERHKKTWSEAIIDSIDFDESSGFSEYEVLGTFVANWTGRALEWQSGAWSLYGVAKQIGRCISRKNPPPPRNDFMAVEGWAQPKWGYVKIDETILKLRSFVGAVISRIKARLLRSLGPGRRLSLELGEIFDLQSDLRVVQIGANDGIQSDPLRQFFQTPSSYSAKLVEPIAYYCDKLRSLYGGRRDIEVLNLSVGSKTGSLELFHISPPVAYRMNGEGPANNWALGQGSSNRATVVYWIYKNAWRGEAYSKQIPNYIAAIEKISVPMVPTRELIDTPKKTLLVVDVQGMEAEIIMGLDKCALPRWVVLEEDLGKTTATELLIDLGYSATRIGTDVLFELNIS